MCDESGPLSAGGGNDCDRWRDVLLRAFVQNAGGMALLDLGGKVLLANEAFAAMHGWTADELAGRHISAFQVGGQDGAARAVRREMFNTGTFDGEVRHVRRDGSVFPALMQITLVRDDVDKPLASIATIRDVTASELATHALRVSEGRFRNLLEALPSIAVQGYDVNGTVHYWNKASEDVYGYSADEAVGRDIVELARGIGRSMILGMVILSW